MTMDDVPNSTGAGAGGGTTTAATTPPPAKISGIARDDAKQPLHKAAVRLEPKAAPDQAISQETTAEGRYEFAVAPGEYKLSAALVHHTFGEEAVSVQAGAHAQKDLVGRRAKYRIKGRITDADGEAVHNARVEISAGPEKVYAVTDRFGDYASPELPALVTYPLTPAKPAYKFTPGSARVGPLKADQTAVTFVAHVQFYDIRGVVRDSEGQPLGGVMMTLEGARVWTARTDSTGVFSFPPVRGARNYTLTPYIQGQVFAPPALHVSYLSEEINQSFYAAADPGLASDKAPNPWAIVNDYSKTVITLASGFLAVTVTFSAQLIGKDQDPWSNGLLAATWIFLVLAVMCGVLTAAFLIQYLRWKKNDGALTWLANASYFLLALAGASFLWFGLHTVYSNKTWEAATVVEKTRKRMPDLVEVEGPSSAQKWVVQSLVWEPASKTYVLFVDEEASSRRYRVVVDPARADVVRFDLAPAPTPTPTPTPGE